MSPRLPLQLPPQGVEVVEDLEVGLLLLRVVLVAELGETVLDVVDLAEDELSPVVLAVLDGTVPEPKHLFLVLEVVGVGEAAHVLPGRVCEEEGGVLAIGAVIGLHPGAEEETVGSVCVLDLAEDSS